jgi:RNA polymerase sigma-70 factor (ECF subfamily)
LLKVTATLTQAAGQSHELRFTEFVEKQSHFVFKVAWAVLRNAQDAEDVVQEVFLKLYQNHAWETVCDERAFLARSTWRLALNRVRSGKNIGPQQDSSDQQPDPERALLTSDWTTLVHRLMDALPEELRLPLALSAIDELTSPEIAAVMGIPEGTVRTRIMRARQILIQKLAKYEVGNANEE